MTLVRDVATLQQEQKVPTDKRPNPQQRLKQKQRMGNEREKKKGQA